MSDKLKDPNLEAHFHRNINTVLRIGFIALLFVVSYVILKPFLGPVIWGIILAVAIYPLHKKLSKLLGNKEKLSVIILVLAGISIIVVPSVLITSSTVDSLIEMADIMSEGSFKVPPPDASVADWPIVGTSIHKTWEMASTNLTAAVMQFEPQIKEFAPAVLSFASGLAGSILMFIVSIIIAGVLIMNTKAAEKTTRGIFKTLAGPDGEEFTSLSGATIRSVVTGVLGTAIIQTVFLSIGLYAVGFPAAGVLTLIVLFVAIIQLPPALIMIPVIIYAYTFASPTAASIFMVWSLIWSAADSFIKPLIMGRGMDIPMLVILLGAIGGMMAGGIIGLFIGAVMLAFTYKIFLALFKA